MANGSNGKDLLIGAVIGGVLGAATALLFAPKSGKELRGDIAEQVQTVSEKTQQVAGTVNQKTQEIARTVGSQTTEWVGKAKNAAITVVDEVRSWRDSGHKLTLDDTNSSSEAAEDLVILK
ncbi:YtxH-like protein [compost metagenome]